jgi:inositol-pentakisphosphate 2-kinase
MDCKWAVSDWRYSGEGGKHALFAYQSSFKQLEWTGRLLRIDKTLLRQAGRILEAAGNQPKEFFDSANATKNFSESRHDDDSLIFLRDIMKPHFGQYLDLPERVCLPWQFVEHLYRTTLERQPCPLPKARRKDWVASDKDESPQGVALAWLVPDYCQHILRNMPATSSSGPCLSVEIKPKAGYLASSPLVDPKHISKFMQSRFALLQTLDRLGYTDQVHRGWKDTFNGSKEMIPISRSSCYDPIDLFSDDSSRIQRALDAMWESPQNNFKLWFTPDDNGSDAMLLVGQHSEITKHVTAGNANNQHLMDLVSTGGDCHTSMKPVLVDLISCILQAESTLLKKLLKWQLLDVLDGDGAILVYQRLVELCQGSHEEAQKLLDSSYLTVKKDMADNLTAPLPGSPLDPPLNPCPAFEALCRDIRRFSEAMQSQQAQFCTGDNSNEPTRENDILLLLQKEHKASRAACLKHIASIESKEACCYLIQNWLLSLAVCDVSFFVTMQWAPLEIAARDINATKTRLLQHQSESTPGMVETFVQDRETGTLAMGLHYTIKLIDCDKKPSKKLETRAKKEELFRYLNRREWEESSNG